MSSERRTFGLRLALWYATLFVAGAIAIVFVTYYLTATSLAQRDQQIIRGKLGDYAAAYQRGGVRVASMAGTTTVEWAGRTIEVSAGTSFASEAAAEVPAGMAAGFAVTARAALPGGETLSHPAPLDTVAV